METGNVQVKSSQTAYDRDAAVKRLRSLRDFHAKRGNAATAAGVEAAIRVLRGML